MDTQTRNLLFNRASSAPKLTPSEKAEREREAQEQVSQEMFVLAGGVISKTEYSTKWLLDGQLHREDGPALVHQDGTTEWYLNGVLHRQGEPAVERVHGMKEWWSKGIRHREEGPAIVYSQTVASYWLDGVMYTPDMYPKALSLRQAKH